MIILILLHNDCILALSKFTWEGKAEEILIFFPRESSVVRVGHRLFYPDTVCLFSGSSA